MAAGRSESARASKKSSVYGQRVGFFIAFFILAPVILVLM